MLFRSPDVDISGVETVEMKHVAEGNRIRTYVLVTLPTAGRVNGNAKESAKEAFKELDTVTREQKGETSKVEVTPVPPAPATAPKSQEVSVVKPDGSTSTLNLLPVENAEYKARREEALQKPGAVVGQVTVR